MDYDLAIIGGGPAGYTAAERAAGSGLKTVMFEKKTVGGVCLNEGCIPTKALLYSAKILDHATNAAKYGITVEGKAEPDLAKMQARKSKVVKKLVGGVQMTLKSYGITTIEGEAMIKGENNGQFEVECGGETYRTKYLIICTGSETIVPPVKGIDKVPCLTSREALEMTEFPESIAIIGGGVIGIEFASFYNMMGVKVTVIEMMPEILGPMDKELTVMFRNDMAKKGVEFHLNAKVTEVANDHVVIEKDGETSTIKTDAILLSVGRKPVIDNFGLETLNVKSGKKGVEVDQYMQTSHRNVYACGDITGFSMLAHTAIREGEVAVNHILGVDDEVNYNAVPGVVYANPEFAGVGATEDELAKSGAKFQVLKLPMAYSGRFIIENELGNGLCKLILNDKNEVIGCHMLGNPASELIVIAGIAIQNRVTVEQFRKYVFPHPTVGEIYHECMFS